MTAEGSPTQVPVDAGASLIGRSFRSGGMRSRPRLLDLGVAGHDIDDTGAWLRTGRSLRRQGEGVKLFVTSSQPGPAAGRPARLDWLDVDGEPLRRQPGTITARYPGHRIHVDVKKVGRIPAGGGWWFQGRGSDTDGPDDPGPRTAVPGSTTPTSTRPWTCSPA